MTTFCILLDGPITNDGRVIRIINTLSQESKVDLYYVDGDIKDDEIFNKNVRVFSTKTNSNWFLTNILFYKKYKEIKRTVLHQKTKYDFIYCNDYPLLDTAVYLKSQYKGSKLIYDCHEIYIETLNQFFPTSGFKSIYGKILINLNKYLHSVKEKKLARKVDLLVTVSDTIKNYLCEKLDITNAITLRNCPTLGIVKSKKNLLRESLGLSSDTFLFLYQGTLNPGRGIEKMIESSIFFEDNVHLIIIGDGPNREQFESMAMKYKASNIHYLGQIPFSELLDYIGSADIGALFIQPINKSKEFCLPNKLFEYMASGIPLLTNGLHEFKSIINECNCGVTILDDRPDEIAKTINELAKKENKSYLEKLGSKGREIYEKKYHWEKEVVNLTNAINILKTKR